MRHIAITFILGITFFSSSFAQPGKAEVSVDDYLKIANDLIFQSSYYNAIEYLEQARAIRPDDPNIWYRLADAQVLSRNYEEAVKCFEKVLKSGDESIFLSFPLIRFEYGDALMRIGDYDRAIVQFQGFLDNYRGNKVAYYREWANRKLDGCYLGMDPLDKTEIFEVENLGPEVNSPYTNYAPRELANDYLMFSSLRSTERITANEQAAKSKVYLSQKIDGEWSTPNLFTGPTRAGNEHIGHGAYSQDGQRFYFTRCPQQENYQVLCNIFYSEYRNGIWTSPKSLRLINDKKAQSTTPHIVMLDNGIERIYFSSNREGGLGGMDIWSVDRDLEGNFGNLMNLGPQVNTPFDEISPHFKKGEEVLYFSSDGHPGIGGFDIFKIYQNNDSWGLVINMGTPYNSPLDDTYFSPSGDETGFFVSNREGGYGLDHPTCCDNIYEIDSMPPPTTDFLIPLSGVVRDDIGKALIGAQVSLYQVVDGSPIWVDEMLSRNDGSYDLLLLNPNTYQVQVAYEGRVTQRVNFETVETREGEEFGRDFNLVEAKWVLSGLISEKTMEGEKDINSFVASLFDSYGNLLETKVGVTTNKYEFELEPGKGYYLLVEKVGYQAYNFECSTEDPSKIGPIQHNVRMIRNQ